MAEIGTTVLKRNLVKDTHLKQDLLNKSWTSCYSPTVETYNDMAFGDIFLHLLTGHLTLLSDEFGSEEFCSVVFDGFLLTSFSRWADSSRSYLHPHSQCTQTSLFLCDFPVKRTSTDTPSGCCCIYTTKCCHRTWKLCWKLLNLRNRLASFLHSVCALKWTWVVMMGRIRNRSPGFLCSMEFGLDKYGQKKKRV